MYFPIYNHSECKTMHYDALNYANLIYKNTNVFNIKKKYILFETQTSSSVSCVNGCSVDLVPISISFSQHEKKTDRYCHRLD